MSPKSTITFAVLFCLITFTENLSAQALTVTITGTGFCNWNRTGSLTATPAGGTPPYSYIWSDNETSQIIYYLTPGNYCVIVTDNLGVSVSACGNTTSELNAAITTVPETCSQADGTAWLDITTGTPPYTIIWSTGAITDTVHSLSYGEYWVKITDSAGCFPGASTLDSFGRIKFFEARNVPFTHSITFTPHHCPILGTAAEHVTGGTPPITYTWSTTPSQTTDSVSGLIAGTYTVTVSDATAGCSVVDTAIINNDLPISANYTSTPEVCNFNNGTATVIPQSGIPPYTYMWNTVPVQNAITAVNLSTGGYTVTVLDANNCMVVKNTYVGYTQPIQLNIQTTNEKCNNNAGSISLSPNVGTPPYTYLWSTSAVSSLITGLSTGYYSVTVHDAAGCTVAGSSYISNVPSYSVTITYTPSACLTNNGTATASVTGTSGPYTFKWGTAPLQTSQTATGLAVGSYTCTVTDVNGCSGIYGVTIPYASYVYASIVPHKAYCNTPTGSITSTISGGTSPYTYLWSNNATTTSISNLMSGYYGVTITDVNGCRTVKGVYVGRYSNINLNIGTTNASCIYTNDGQAIAVATNATPPLQYQWSNGQTSQTATGLAPGWEYWATVTDANGCSASGQSYPVGYSGTSCAAIVSGKVVRDNDENCAWTTGDEGIPNINVQAIAGFYDITDANGDYSFILPPGNYALNHTVPYHTFRECPQGAIPLLGLTAGTTVVSQNFYDTVRNAYDLSATFNYNTTPSPGFQHYVDINYGNEGNIMTNAVIEFDYDADLVFVSASAAYTLDLINHKVYFSIVSLAVGFHNYIQLTFLTPAGTPLGTDITECVHITPVQNDVNFVNNDECLSIAVVGSFDPNEKTVKPAGMGAQGIITRADSVLHYTIRFQNTGTDYAQNIEILDSLDTDLDWSSIYGITSSHPYALHTDFFENKTLAFYFDNIYLIDSLRNETGSHGFVSFYIKLKPGLPDGTEIKNRAAIYFDYNTPILTNTVLNTISAPTAIEEPEITTVKVYPNPSSTAVNVEFESLANTKITLVIQNVLGAISKTVFAEAATGKNIIAVPLAELSAGVYFLSIQSEKEKFAAAKVIKQ